jgi:hypothetical protein
MENEGIMALPQSAAMQDGGEAQPRQMVTSFDSYDAAQTALGRVNPGDLATLKESLRQNMAELQLSPSQLTTLIEVFEYVSQNPREYKTIRADLIRNDFVDAEDLPEEYDPEFLGAILVVLNELQGISAQGAQAPMVDMPPVEGADAMQGMGPMQPMAMAEGGLADVASFLAAQGRNGDSMLAHITPEEAELLRARGGSGTINPATGLPEFFIKKIFKGVANVFKSVVNVVKKVVQSPVGRILGTIALATVLGPTAIGMSLGTAGTAALASGTVTLAAGGSMKDALVAGALGYVGGGGTIMGVNPVSAVGSYLPGAAGSALNTGLATGAIGTGVGLVAGMKPVDALRMGAMSGASAAALQGLRGVGGVDSSGKMLTGDEVAMRNDVFRRAMEGDPAANQALQTGDYSAFTGAARGGIGATGTTGTAQDLLSQRPGTGFTGTGEVGFRPPEGSFGPQDFATTAGGTGGATNYSLMPSNAPPSVGMQPAAAFGPMDLSRAAGGTGATTNYGLTPATTQAPAQPANLMDRMISGAKDFYSENLSPSRPGLPADAGLLRKYGPLALAGTAVASAAGGFESQPSDPNPAFDRSYTGVDYMRDNPEMFRGGLDNYRRPTNPSPVVVPTPSYASIPMGQPGGMMPGGITRSPGGVAQPYNVSGLYGVPLLYGQQPPGYAKGGELRETEFPRKTGPINGPGTGTSDSIPAMLSDGEFVFTAKAVRNAGAGSRRKGAARMYKLMKMLEGGPVKAT